MKTLPPCESAVTTFLKSPDDNVARELVALANTLGGDLYVGVDPAGRVAGVPELDRAEMRILPQRRIPSKRQPRRDSFSDIQSAGLPPCERGGTGTAEADYQAMRTPRLQRQGDSTSPPSV